MIIYNNEIIGLFIIQELLGKIKKIELVKIPLAFSILLHKRSLHYLSNSKTDIISSQDFFFKKPELIVSIHKRFYNNLPIVVNSINLSIENNIIQLDDNGNAIFIKNLWDDNGINIEKTFGKRIYLIKKSIPKIKNILNDNTEIIFHLYGVKL